MCPFFLFPIFLTFQLRQRFSMWRKQDKPRPRGSVRMTSFGDNHTGPGACSVFSFSFRRGCVRRRPDARTPPCPSASPVFLFIFHAYTAFRRNGHANAGHPRCRQLLTSPPLHCCESLLFKFLSMSPLSPLPCPTYLHTNLLPFPFFPSHSVVGTPTLLTPHMWSHVVLFGVTLRLHLRTHTLLPSCVRRHPDR